MGGEKTSKPKRDSWPKTTWSRFGTGLALTLDLARNIPRGKFRGVAESAMPRRRSAKPYQDDERRSSIMLCMLIVQGNFPMFFVLFPGAGTEYIKHDENKGDRNTDEPAVVQQKLRDCLHELSPSSS